MRAAALPALTGTFIYALTSSAGDIIRHEQVFGERSGLAATLIFCLMAVVWFAMSLRQGLQLPRKGVFGLSLGFDEVRLGASMLGFLFVLAIVLALLGFGVFLLIMIVTAAGAGALNGEDIAEADLFASPQAFSEFLSSGGAGTFVTIAGGAILATAVFFLVWLVLRLLPFAAATIDQKRFVVLQAASWTRYHDIALILGGILTIGVGATFIATARYGVAALPIPLIGAAFLKHVATCFGALLFVGFITTVYTRLVKDDGVDPHKPRQ
ncbi:MAG: hypothetical protein AAF724_23210 [Pseudomonadota bacterium]